MIYRIVDLGVNSVYQLDIIVIFTSPQPPFWFRISEDFPGKSSDTIQILSVCLSRLKLREKMKVLLFGLALSALSSHMAQSFYINGCAGSSVGCIKSRLSRCPGLAQSPRPKASSLRMMADEGLNNKKDPLEVATNVILQVRNYAYHAGGNTSWAF